MHFLDSMSAQDISNEMDIEYRKTLAMIRKIKEKSAAYIEKTDRDLAAI